MIFRIESWKLYLGLIIIYLIFFLPNQLNIIEHMVLTKPIANRRVVVIDPGHGGVDGGTSYNGLLEKKINLEIGLKLKACLEQKQNVKVIMTRDKDTALDHLNKYSHSRHTRDLRARVDIINREKVDLFISLHVDNRPSQAYIRGPMVLYYPRHPQNKIIADIIQKHLNRLDYPGVKSTDHQIKKRKDLYVLKAKNTPGVLIEVGFISNYQDRKLLQQDDYQQILVENIYQGIEEYFSSFKFLNNLYK